MTDVLSVGDIVKMKTHKGTLTSDDLWEITFVEGHRIRFRNVSDYQKNSKIAEQGWDSSMVKKIL